MKNSQYYNSAVNSEGVLVLYILSRAVCYIEADFNKIDTHQV